RQGLSLSAGAMAAMLSENAASACLPASVISSTIKAAGAYAAGPAAEGAISTNVVALTHGVLRTMWLTKLKIASAVLVAITVVGVGAGSLIFQAQAVDSKDKINAVDPDQ